MGSRWLYLSVGFSVFGAVAGALAGVLWFTLMEMGFVVLYWYLAENARHTENIELLTTYETSKNKEGTTNAPTEEDDKQ